MPPRRRHGLFGSPDRLATYAGLAPAPRDSGNGSGDRHRPKRYHRRLQRALFLAAMSSITCCSESRRYYDRKRAEGKRHSQAVLALARRRVNVLWALLRDQRHYEPMPPAATAPQGFSSRKPDRREPTSQRGSHQHGTMTLRSPCDHARSTGHRPVRCLRRHHDLRCRSVLRQRHALLGHRRTMLRLPERVVRAGQRIRHTREHSTSSAASTRGGTAFACPETC
ncbi:transposase [Streptomyces sp. NPDC057193]|uniref:transposase n=1 Tax=Streptomyces sp. NPDC057193 TaxID=3346043 RepID=UPI0036250863